MDYSLSTEGRGFEVFEIRMRATFGLREEIVEAIRDAVNTAEAILISEVPRDSGVLANSIRVGGIVYSPGGAGGGGFWEAEVSIGEGVPYLKHVIEGTGIYGSTGHMIYPANGNVMRIQKEGENTRYVRYTRGQESNDLWLLKAQEAVNEVIRQAVSRIDALHE